MMKTRAAVLRKGGEPWELAELDLDEPKAGEVVIRYEAAGLCHSDEHIRATGTARFPLVGGHEGAGVVKIEDDIPFELAALVSCGVTTYPRDL
jgi:alcohol dehydrogenase (nicotinoprotein)